MKRFLFLLLSIIVSFRLFFVSIFFFLEYFAVSAPPDMENGAALALLSIAVSLFGLLVNVIFYITAFRRTSLEKRYKIDIKELFINRKDRLLRNIIRIIGYAVMTSFLSFIVFDVFIKGKPFLEFYSWSIICTLLYIVWINNIFREQDAGCKQKMQLRNTYYN